MKSDRLGHSSSSGNRLSGSNDDSSVVSLKALVAKVDSSASTPRATSFEDSGLIDLKKLMANAPAPSSDALPPVLAPNEAGLFAVPEPTLTPPVHGDLSLSGDAPKNGSRGHAKWLVAAMVTMIAVVGTIGILQARTSPVAQTERATSPAVQPPPSEPQRFVEAKPAPEAVAPVVAAEPEKVEAQASATSTHPGRKAAISTASRERVRRETPTVKAKPEETPKSSTPCDLMCEMRRAASNKTAK